jgi:K+-transporting ATPase ATPase C chain
MKALKLLRPALWTLAFFIATTALYSLAVTGLGAALFPQRAGGSLVPGDGKPRGSFLIGQDSVRPDRFHGRPSAVGYDPEAGGASNLGPTSSALASQIAARRAALVAENGAGEPPEDLLLASASGLDPEISPRAALYQVPRVAASLGLGADGEAEIRALVAARAKGRPLGFLGEPRVNVLELNLALERLYGARHAAQGR